ncbi:hypothetical protein FA95DRAFT_1499121, partial [Auriscalpium vulgare]
MPIDALIRQPKKDLLDICDTHDIIVKPRSDRASLSALIQSHNIRSCAACLAASTFFRYVGGPSLTSTERSRIHRANKASAIKIHVSDGRPKDLTHAEFPPPPPSQILQQRIVRDYCQDIQFDMIKEEGCKICGILTLSKHLIPWSD